MNADARPMHADDIVPASAFISALLFTALPDSVSLHPSYGPSAVQARLRSSDEAQRNPGLLVCVVSTERQYWMPMNADDIAPVSALIGVRLFPHCYPTCQSPVGSSLCEPRPEPAGHDGHDLGFLAGKQVIGGVDPDLPTPCNAFQR